MKNKLVVIILSLVLLSAAILAGINYFKKSAEPRPAEETTAANTEKPAVKNFEFKTSPAGKIQDDGKIIRIVHAPEKVKKGEIFNFAWTIKKVGNIKETTHTAIHYDWVSHAGKLGTSEEPDKAGYAFLTKDFLNKNHPLPQTFTIDFAADRTGKLFFRAHAVIDGKNYWTDEQKVIVEE